MILVLGYGNTARADDGLGPAFVERISRRQFTGLHAVADFHLKVEHVDLVAKADTAIFVDAEMSGSSPFSYDRVEPDMSQDFSGHGLSPGAILALSTVLYGQAPDAYLLGITGYHFRVMEEKLSPPACRNLDFAVAFIRRRLFY